jgi:hypothetical protein
MRPDFFAWQWGLYPDGHKTKTNLIIHILTVPMFQLGFLSLLSTPLVGWSGLSGLVGMVIAVAAQGRGHKGEPTAPVPFLGPLDMLSRLFFEQWVTFPRFVLSGGFGRAWREASRA